MYVFLTRITIWATKGNLKKVKKQLQLKGYFTEKEFDEIQDLVCRITNIIDMLDDNKYIEELISLKDELDEYTKLKYLKN